MRGGENEQPVKRRRRSGIRPKARKAPTARLSNTNFQEQLDLRTLERDEALEQLTATSEVLQVISQSTFDLQSVLSTLVRAAGQLCQAENVQIFLRDGEVYRLVADNGFSPEYQQYAKEHPIRPGRNTLVARTSLEGKTVHIPDALADSEYTYGGQKLGGYRTLLGVPLIQDGSCIGVIALTRSKVHPFTDSQIKLVTNFAAQALIAIKNTRLLNELRQRTDDLTESLEQQTATSDVLKVISSSSGKLEPVFQTMLANATRICEAAFGSMLLVEGDVLRRVALHNAPTQFVEFNKKHPVIPLGQVHDLNLLFETRRPVHIADAAGTEDSPIVKYGGARTLVIVPLLKENQIVGAIGIYRQEVRPFTEKQIQLVTNFAAQAVIAIENTRLLNELRQRTDDLSESLEQQVATSEVLQVINASPGDLAPVFGAMLERATRLCEAGFGVLWLFDGERFSAAAEHAIPDALAEFVREPVPVEASASLVKIVEGANIVHVSDLAATELYDTGNRVRRAYVQLGGARTLMSVALRKDNVLLGAFNVYRQEVRPFTDKQIELVKNFAAQAVIAIENTRLLNELRQRTGDLTESLEQQTATSEVLRIIAKSPQSVQPVFDAIVSNAARLCEATFSAVAQFDGELLHLVAVNKMSPEETAAYHTIYPRPPNRSFIMGRAFLDGKPAHVEDIEADPDYDPHTLSVLKAAAPYRTYLGIPILRDGIAIGVIGCGRREVKPFTEAQIALVMSFADQAVIAIENTRLLSELRESLQQQTATADVLKVISRSTFDLQTVLNTLTESAARLCEADMAAIIRQKGAANYWATSYGFPPGLSEYLKSIPIEAGRGTVVGRVLMDGKTVHVSDVLADAEYAYLEVQRRANYRTMLGIPLLREGIPIGIVLLMRHTVRPFAEKQIELAETFADQAVIAIENVRLFESVEARTRELAKSLEDLRTTQDRLVQTQKLASLGQLTAGIAHEIKNPLNFVNNFSGVSAELIDELQEALTDVSLNEKRRSEITELMDTLRGNLDKVMQHGKRADAIVKNMLLHSREGSGEHRPVDINALVEESLNLAYHGARAEKQGFTITMEQSLDPTAGEVDVYPQDITRALLNLIANGFYAATKRKANGGDYEPLLTAATKNLGDRVEIRIRDNGTGIPAEVKEKMFNPFFTTKPAGEGTGLGLSISHDIIVKQHGGSIEVDTQPGEFTEFRIVLPRTAVFPAESEARA
jgi:two-component system, NtrC family, sensor kinase